MTAKAHEVTVSCSCDDIEHCETERYIADVRILVAELDRTRATLHTEGAAECRK